MKYKIRNKICPYCKKSFKAVGKQVYCSKSCQILNSAKVIKENRKNNSSIVKCPMCNKEFIRLQNRRYCSKECAKKGQVEHRREYLHRLYKKPEKTRNEYPTFQEFCGHKFITYLEEGL